MPSDPHALRAALDARFLATWEGELAKPGRGLLRARGSARFPPLLRESIVFAFALDPARGETLARHYTEELPRLLVEQQGGDDDPVRALLHRPIDLACTPRLGAALDGLFSALTRAGIDPAALVGARSPAALIAARPTVAALHAGALFGSGSPMVGAGRAERAVIARELSGEPPDAVLDRRLAGHVVHELCHGRDRDGSPSPPPPWMLLEAAAILLGCDAFPRHVFPAEPGEAVPALALFVLLGDALARLFGRRALFNLLVEPSSFESGFGERAAAVLQVAAWQDFLGRPEPALARDALRALAWIKLADATRAAIPMADLAAALNGATHTSPTDAARALPDLLDLAEGVPWAALPWWSEAPAGGDEALLLNAVRAMFQVHRIGPHFQTLPSEPPGGRLHLDVMACVLSAAPRPDGVYAEPARWLFPPPLCRRLQERGARLVQVTLVSRNACERVTERLVELVRGEGALDEETVI